MNDNVIKIVEDLTHEQLIKWQGIVRRCPDDIEDNYDSQTSTSTSNFILASIPNIYLNWISTLKI